MCSLVLHAEATAQARRRAALRSGLAACRLGGTLREGVDAVPVPASIHPWAAGRILKRLMRGTKVNPGVVRLGLLFGTLVLLWHWLGCFYWCCLTSPCCDCH